MAVIDRVLVGEALYIEDRPDQPACLDLRNVAHIDLIMGPRGSAAEDAFCRTLTDQNNAETRGERGTADGLTRLVHARLARLRRQ